MELKQKVLYTIQGNHLTEYGDGVVVGVSGGPDSACLLHILHSLSGTLGIKLHAVHVNHLLRQSEAQADEDYTADLCRRLGIPLIIVHEDVKEMAGRLGMTVEEAGREARYRAFDACAREVGAARIAVAHNRNDQAETVMMHIIRGSGTAGLAGMEFKRGMVIRPLLDISRSEIEDYCSETGLLPRTDSSNLTCDYTRNRVRLELLPYIDRNFGADIIEGLWRLSTHAAGDNDYLEQCAAEAFKACLGEAADTPRRISLVLDKLQGLHPAILSRVLKLAVCDVTGSCAGLGSVHYQAVTDLIYKGRTGTRTELPRGLRALVSYGRLEVFVDEDSLSAKRAAAASAIELIIPGITQLPEFDASITVSVEKAENIDNYGKIRYNSLVQFFDYDSIKRGINIRNRRDGDIFKPFRSNGTKKLKEYYIDEKIPREKRDEIPLVCVDKEIVWVIGHKISDKFKVTENTKSVLRMEFNRRT